MKAFAQNTASRKTASTHPSAYIPGGFMAILAEEGFEVERKAA